MHVHKPGQWDFKISRRNMSFIRKIAKEKDQQRKDKCTENESSGLMNEGLKLI